MEPWYVCMVISRCRRTDLKRVLMIPKPVLIHNDQVHVNERVVRAHLMSGGGDVKLIISPEVSVDVSVFGAADGLVCGDSGEHR